MKDQRESTGRTVDEAIREALLRMGLRREEVEVTVLQEARGGILGLGRREAKVKVVKKAGSAREGREGREGRGRRQDRPEGGSRSRREGERVDGDPDRRGGQRRGGRGRTAGAEGSDERRTGDRRTRSRGDEPPRAAAAVAADRPGAADQAAPAGAARDRHHEQNDEESRRRRRPRRRRRRSEVEIETAAQGAPDTPPVAAAAAEPAPDRQTPSTDGREAAPREIAEAAAAGDRREEPAATSSAAAEPTPEPTPASGRADRPADVQAAEVVAAARIAPFTAAEAAALPEFLQRVATELMVKSGFPCRVQVQEGEYHLVKMVVDDRSAGVLIGRYGNTVDALEHLVEKIASKAAGERVRMNLDINNYRVRREDQLIQRARVAAAEARDTGEPVSLEPAGGRERRIVHLYIQETGDLTTFTESGEDGKYVVICRENQVPEHYRQRDDDADPGDEAAAGAREPELQIEVGAVIDVEAGGTETESEPRRDA